MDLQPPPPQHQYAPSPPQNPIPNPNLQQQQWQQQQQLHYPNPNPNPNLQQQPQQYYYPNPHPEAASEGAAAGTYAPHGGYSVGPTTSAGATFGEGALAYNYYQGYGWDPPHFHGVDPNSYGQVQPVPSSGLNSTVPSHAISSQRGAKRNYRHGSKKGFRKETEVARPVHCGVCKIECNTQEVLNVHKQGKKHKKNLQKLQESITPKSQRAQMTIHDAEKKETKILGGAGSSEVARQAYCEVCKIYCDTESVLSIHKEGKKHKKNFQKLQYPTTPMPQKDQVTANGEAEEAGSSEVARQAYCEVCKIYCDTGAVLSIHKEGKKHKKNSQKLQYSIAPIPQKDQVTANDEEKEAEPQKDQVTANDEEKVTANDEEKEAEPQKDQVTANDEEKEVTANDEEKEAEPQKDQVTANNEEKEAEPNGVEQQAYCATCNVFCTTQDVLNIHNMGKKHKKNILKSQNSIAQTPHSAGNKDAPISEQEKASGFKQRKRGKVTEEDLETKKRKILDGGAEPGKVKVCTVCNVVVNSQMVYDTHIAAPKHIAMVKKQLEAALVDGNKSVNSENSVHSNLASSG